MNNTTYLNHIYLDPKRHWPMAQNIAKRALEGGNVDSLYRILKSLPRDVTRWVRSTMEEQSDGCKMLELRLWLDFNNAFDIDSVSDFMEKWEDADDADECTDYLIDRGIMVRCDDCNELELSNQTKSHWGDCDAQICRVCIEDNYRYSELYEQYVCSEFSRSALDESGRSCVIHEDDNDFYFSDDEDQYVHNDYEPGSRIIGNYHSSKNYQRVQVSQWTKLKRRYIGVELEVEIPGGHRGEKASKLHRVINGEEFGRKVFFENDGSLSTGFEIISQPMGLDSHRELWSWLKDKSVVRGLRSHNTTTCGLHVHISRDSMSKLQVAKIVSFINDPENEALIRAVARRYAEGYCRIKTKTIGKSAQSDDRYEAVNITPRKTIEFRIFKGSLKYESVMSAIQFSNALVDFCGRANTSIRDLKADKFLEFISSDESGDTDILVPYLNSRLELA